MSLLDRLRPLADRQRAGLGLFAFHLLTPFSLAVSNILLGVLVLASPWTRKTAALDRLVPSRRGSGPLVASLLAYIGCLLSAIVASYDPSASARAVSEIFSLLTLVFALALVRDEAESRWLVGGVIAVSAVVASAGLLQFLQGLGDIEHRIRGPLSHYMTFSGVLLVADLLLVARLTCRGGWRRPLSLLALAAINVALIGSLTRSAWVALGVSLLVLVVLRAPRWLMLLPALAFAFVLLAPTPLLARFGSIVDLSDESNYDRLCMARAGMAMVAERPLFGIGPDLVKDRYPLYRHDSAPRYTVPHLHNSFLQLAAERGLPALGAYLALMAAAMVTALSRFRAEGGFAGPRADLLLGTLLALVAFNVAALFENNWGDSEVQRLVLFVLALPFVSGKSAVTSPTAARGPDPTLVYSRAPGASA